MRSMTYPSDLTDEQRDLIEPYGTRQNNLPDWVLS